ncbi:MAG: hypothetical protein GKR90_09165 [Pseudomonadales bacterium]|nr:hypothetical protein [Pseudomonadales bacterium]
MLHLVLHVLVPAGVSYFWAKHRPESNWFAVFLILMVGMLIDVDHLLATPIYDPGRCSVGFHPLHTLIPIGCYLALFAHERTRIVGLGLLIHLALDSLDCRVNTGMWWT